MNVRVFKLINGEVVIGEVKEENDGFMVLKGAANIILQQNDSGVGVGIADYMPYSSGPVTLRVSAIASEASPDSKLENEYNRIYGSGLIMASAADLKGLQK